MKNHNFPEKQGLYDPRFERDSCGVGFVCNIDGRKSHDIIKKGIEVLNRLSHRGAVGADPKTGDGAGILIQIPHKFLAKECRKTGITLPASGQYGTGLVFLPRKKDEKDFCVNVFDKIIKEEKQRLLGWRRVPLDSSIIGTTAKKTEPVIHQVFIGKDSAVRGQLQFERKLYVIRKRAETAIRASRLGQKSFFYITNISSRTLSYKGLLMPGQLDSYFLDLKNKALESAIAIVHSRYSTNTFPTWDLAQPFRFLAHNGEINTLRGNINWMKAREKLLSTELLGEDMEKIKPVIVPGGSDSASLDNVFELLALTGRGLSHSIMMLIPCAWEQNNLMPKKLRDFYKYHACLMEPWDGPAAIAFTDGQEVGAVLDRNGLRPARYIVTKSGLVEMASEAGVLDIDPREIKISGRLEPGKIFLVDTEKKKIIDDDKIKETMAVRRPYGAWIKKHMVSLDGIACLPARLTAKPWARQASGCFQPPRFLGQPLLSTAEVGSIPRDDIVTSLKAFGYTREDLKFIIKPMAEKGAEPIGSMGNDTPHAILSKKPKLLYDYFKQLFAQVTNPAIDPIREGIVMSLDSFIGFQKNILEETEAHCRKLWVKEPVITNEDLEKIRHINIKGFKTKTISILFKPDDEKDFENTLDRICREAESAIDEGYTFVILSDMGADMKHAALPALLAAARVHHHLIRQALRTRLGIIIESGEPREVHHFALLLGYGADCINPYLAYEALRYLIAKGELSIDTDQAVKKYRKAAHNGILKIISKMGISTLQSYRGAQIFEALGLGDNLIEECFTGTPSRIGGAGIEELAKETIMRHKAAYLETEAISSRAYLLTGGLYQWNKDGEFHLWNPDTIAALQDAIRSGDYSRYKEFAALINNQSGNPTTIRGLLKIKKNRKAIPIHEVEPVEEIVKRFATGAMSFGSISKAAHETLAIAMNRLGARSNTGEGGEDPMRFVSLPNGDYKRSAIKQVASGRFGVVTNYLVNAEELQIKIAQGAKPGEGGQLPGHKVSEIIAKTRYTTPGVTLISPPPHHDIYSIEDLAELIFDLKNVNPKARISVKLVSEVGVGTIAAGVAKGHADMILICGGDGGTGASPLSSIRYAGLPWELGLSETHQTLVLNNLRQRVRLQTDGQMRTGRDAACAALLGAEEYGFATAPLVAMGCVMLRHCHLNNCAVGIATQDEILERRFTGKPEHIVNYFRFVAEELREIMAGLGMRTIDEMIGRTDLLEIDRGALPWKAKELDYSKILYKPKVNSKIGVYCQAKQDHNIDSVMDRKLIKLAKPCLEKAEPVRMEFDIKNSDRATGAMLSGEVCMQYGESALPEDAIYCKFRGIAGQSFGAFLVKGIKFELEGLANDYVGKGMSGGKIIIYPDKKTSYLSEENVIIGNTTFYGATSGEAYIRGITGERFCIRNSGLYAVSEGVGDHACEYMTGGRVLILGKTGRNFAAGMSGGIAYVYDKNKSFKNNLNRKMVLLEKLKDEDKELVRQLTENHYRYTGSASAKRLLNNFKKEFNNFVKVIPIEYKHILEGMKVEEKPDLTEVSDG